jgi:hypothetical protein
LNLSSKLITSDGRFESTAAGGMTLTADHANLNLTSSTGNIELTAGASSQIQLQSDAYLATSKLVAGSASGGLFTTQSGPLTLSPATEVVFTVPVHSTNGNVVADNTNLILSTATLGDIELNPASGSVVSTTAAINTSSGVLNSSVPFTLTSASTIALNTDGTAALSTNAPLITSSGSVEGTSGLTLTTGSRAIALEPASGQAVSTSAKILTTNALIESTVASTYSTDAGDLTLSPAGNLVVTAPLITQSHITSSASQPLVLSGSSGTVQIEGNLQVSGTLEQVNTTQLNVQDKTILLAGSAGSDALASGAGIVIDGSAYSTDSKAVSLLWSTATDNLPASYWNFRGGDFAFQRQTASNGDVPFHPFHH